MIKSIRDYEASTMLNYPGERHDSNFLLLDGEMVVDVSAQPEVAIMEIDAILKQRGLAQVEERVPVLAFGRNASPQGVAIKATKYSDGLFSSEDLGTVPMLKASLKGHDVVWHGRPGQGGGYFGELIDSPENTDSEIEVWVQFLTNEQLAAIHTSEGATYEVSEIPNVSLGDGFSINTVGYTSRDASVLLDNDGQPISVKGINRSDFNITQEMDVRGALEHILGQEAVIAVLAEKHNPETFIEALKIMPLNGEKGRKELQVKVQAALAKHGLTKSFRYDGDGLRFSRTDFGTLPRGVKKKPIHQSTVHLMEEYISGIRPTSEQLEAKRVQLRIQYPNKSDEAIAIQARSILDPAQKLRKFSSGALLDPVREKRLRAIHSK